MKVKNTGTAGHFICQVYVKAGEEAELPDSQREKVSSAIDAGAHFEIVADEKPKVESKSKPKRRPRKRSE